MMKIKEIASILIVTVVLGFLINLAKTWDILLKSICLIFLVLAINVFSKKIIAYYFESEIEIKLWNILRFGFKPHRKFKKSFPAGIILPFLSKAIFFPLNNFIWMASLVFDVKPKVYRAAKRHGLYRFSEITEYHIGLIAAAGIFANLATALISYFLNFPEFAKLNVYFVFFNILPLSDLDGNKIFFGSKTLWNFLATIVLIALAYIILVI